MQVFVEEIGIWMDSMDAHKHFSRLLPFHALNEPMLLHAFLACGARHLALVNPKYSEEKALHYYDIATRDLLHSLQDPDRDTILCATTAVILNVYEIMGERALQRMNHIAGPCAGQRVSVERKIDRHRCCVLLAERRHGDPELSAFQLAGRVGS
jgi:hypothetical protein